MSRRSAGPTSPAPAGHVSRDLPNILCPIASRNTKTAQRLRRHVITRLFRQLYSPVRNALPPIRLWLIAPSAPCITTQSYDGLSRNLPRAACAHLMRPGLIPIICISYDELLQCTRFSTGIMLANSAHRTIWDSPCADSSASRFLATIASA